jgi:hypothetical protein
MRSGWPATDCERLPLQCCFGVKVAPLYRRNEMRPLPGQ